LAPESGYVCANMEAIKGRSFYCRVHGNEENGIGYGKLTILDVSETPPAQDLGASNQAVAAPLKVSANSIFVEFEPDKTGKASPELQLQLDTCPARDGHVWIRYSGAGKIPLDMKGLNDPYYQLFIEAPGYAFQRIELARGSDGNYRPSGKDSVIRMYRHRYVTVQYAFNAGQNRNLSVPDETGTATLTHWKRLANFGGRDWRIWQSGTMPHLHFDRYNDGFGLVSAQNTGFEQMTQAPESGYVCTEMEAIKGRSFYCRVNGYEDIGIGYGKLTILDVSETPPAQDLGDSNQAAAASFHVPSNSVSVEFEPDKTGKASPKLQLQLETMKGNDRLWRRSADAGKIVLDMKGLKDPGYRLILEAPGYASQWIELVRESEGNYRPSVEDTVIRMYRHRYVTVHYAFNAGQNRNLSAPDESGTVTLTHWKGLPNFEMDWQIRQNGPMPHLHFHRINNGFGLVSAQNTSFEQMTLAPESGYVFADMEAIKGRSFYCRVHGNDEHGIGYGKLTILDVSETPPAQDLGASNR